MSKVVVVEKDAALFRPSIELITAAPTAIHSADSCFGTITSSTAQSLIYKVFREMSKRAAEGEH